MKQKVKLQLSAGILMFAAVLAGACKKENQKAEGSAEEKELAGNVNAVNAISSDINLNWDNLVNGSTYTNSQASAGFGNVTGWNESRAYITNGKTANGARVTLLPNALSGAGGLISNTDISDGTAYELDYDVKFHSQFTFGKGGKIGFGFKVGKGQTGGESTANGDGGSLRLMWYASSSDRVFFQPYYYHADMGQVYGDTDSGYPRYPASGSLQKGVWYHVHVYIKSNTGTSTNGHAQILINGTPILDQDIRWTTQDSQRQIKDLTFHTFRGGSTNDWATNTTDYIYYDNLVVHKIQ